MRYVNLSPIDKKANSVVKKGNLRRRVTGNKPDAAEIARVL